MATWHTATTVLINSKHNVGRIEFKESNIMQKEYQQPQMDVLAFTAHEPVAYDEKVEDAGAVTPPTLS